MNTLTKILMTAALLVVGYFMFIGLFYVVAAGALLILALYGFSLVQKLWRRVFGGEPEAQRPSMFTVKVQRGWTEREARVFGDHISRHHPGSGDSSVNDANGEAQLNSRGNSRGKKPSQIKVIDVT